MTDARGLVFNVQRSSFHDGPGIRTTVFFKGCPLRCAWCHNPESLERAPQVVVNTARCLGCGTCRSRCPRAAGPLPSGARVGTDGCVACGACADACPSTARQIVGREWTVPEVIAELLRDRGVYDESDGGVTFSGGEPLAQPGFLRRCLDACRREALHAAVDTCGFAPREIVLDVAARCDLLLWDVKHLDPARHRALTGVPLEPILDNLAAAAALGTPIWLRVPVVPGLNDDDVNLGAVARLAAATPGVRRVSLLPYHRTGAAKRERLGAVDGCAGVQPPGAQRMAEIAAALGAIAPVVSIGG